ncbi:MAG: thymidine phosphorylase, partial [Gammaproteobacteria bacterium]
KVGSGAFMPTPEKSLELAESIVSVGNGAGTRTSAILTGMNESLCHAAGNAVEVRVAIDYLTGKSRPARLHEVTMALCAEMLVLGGLALDDAMARAKLQRALDNGDAAERFARMVAALGGPDDLLDRPHAYLDKAPVMVPVPALGTGYVSQVDTRALGLAVVGLGGGRRRPQDPIDFAVGLTELAELGDEVALGQPLAMVHARSDAAAEQAVREVQAAYRIGGARRPANPIIYQTIRPDTV